MEVTWSLFKQFPVSCSMNLHTCCGLVFEILAYARSIEHGKPGRMAIKHFKEKAFGDELMRNCKSHHALYGGALSARWVPRYSTVRCAVPSVDTVETGDQLLMPRCREMTFFFLHFNGCCFYVIHCSRCYGKNWAGKGRQYSCTCSDSLEYRLVFQLHLLHL